MVEYAAIALVLVAALFTPADIFHGQTGAAFMADMIKAFFRNLTHYISLP
ncbi:hypothetical protein AACH06_09705 [Ideonella sp. DXS29W]|uniref:Flp family type IVb pilin n=1 Tax=Ideonella lacteola TaxID=2984193 RepID=A0ABU9BMB8_9BURK